MMDYVRCGREWKCQSWYFDLFLCSFLLLHMHGLVPFFGCLFLVLVFVVFHHNFEPLLSYFSIFFYFVPFTFFEYTFNTYLRWSDSSLVDLFLAYGCSHLWLTLKLGTFLIIKVLWTYLKLSRCNVKPLPLEMMHCELVHKNQHRQKCPICSNLFCDHGKL